MLPHLAARRNTRGFKTPNTLVLQRHEARPQRLHILGDRTQWESHFRRKVVFLKRPADKYGTVRDQFCNIFLQAKHVDGWIRIAVLGDELGSDQSCPRGRWARS